MKVVYAKTPYAYVWADNNQVHKQGKVFPEQALRVIKETVDWYEIQMPNLDREVDLSVYPHFWIRKEDTVDSHGDLPVYDEDEPVEFGPVSDEDVAIAILTILQWFKQ